MWEKNNDEQSHDKTQSSKRWFNKSTLSTAFGSQKDKPSIEHASHGCSNQMEIARDKDRTGCKNKPNDGGQGHSSRHYAVVHYSK